MKRSALCLVLCALAWGCGDDDGGTDGGRDASRDAPAVDGARPDAAGTDGGGGGVDTGVCVPSVEICGDRIDQNCDGRDTSCGDTDGDRFEACRAGDDLTMCDCDDAQATVYPGHPEECDGFDNDCNGRVDEIAECCTACAGMPAGAGDICTEDGQCDCAGEPGIGVCGAGQTCCGAGCTNIQTDIMNCGFCGTACSNQADGCTAGDCTCGSGPVCDFTTMCSGGSC